MSLVTTSYTTAQLERLNRTSILKRFLRESGLGLYGVVDSGTTGTIVDTARLSHPAFNDDTFQGWAYILKDAGGAAAAPEGEIQSIDPDEFAASTGTVGVYGTFSAAPAAGDEFAIFHMIHPQDVLDHLDELLKHEIYLPAWAILSHVPDGDMEQSALTDWTDTNATSAKSTAEPAMNGSRWMTVTASADNGYTSSVSLYVHPGERYHMSALARTDGSTQAKLVAYDVTNAAEIDSVSTSATSTVRVWKEFSAPSGCYEIKLRLQTVTNGQVTSWDDVCFFSPNETELPLPWWVKDSDQVHGVYYLRPYSTVSANEWQPAYRGERDQRWDKHDEAFGRGMLRVNARQGSAVYPLYIKGTRNETAFSNNNTDYKRLDPNLITAGLCYKVFSQLSNLPQTGTLNVDWIKEKANIWRSEWEMQKRRHLLRLEQEETSEAPEAMFIRSPRSYHSPGYEYREWNVR